MNNKLVITIVIITCCCGGCLETRRPQRRANLTISAPQTDTTVQLESKVISLFGNEFTPRSSSASRTRTIRRQIAEKKEIYETYPDSVEVLLAYARLLDENGKYLTANEVYKENLRRFANEASLYQYKGLNEIVLRNFPQAIKDLSIAVLLNRGEEVVPDPYHSDRLSKGSRQFYCWYYLGLAYYFNRNYDSAISSFNKCLSIEAQDDLIVMPYYWLYIIYQEIGNPEVAATFLEGVNTRMTIDKSKDYFRGLLLFKGIFRAERLLSFSVGDKGNITSPIQIYSLAIYHRLKGNSDEARTLINRSIDSGYWDDLGFIAAEVDSYYYVNNLN